MKRTSSPHDAVATVWAISSPEAIAGGQQLPNSSGWKEVRGKDVWVYLRLTKTAARALAEQLLHAADSDSSDREVYCGRPQGAWSDEVLDDGSGLFLHPLSASLSVRIADVPDIDHLMKEPADSTKLLSPAPGGRSHFPESD